MNASNVERGAARTFSLQLWRQHIAGYAASLAVNRIAGLSLTKSPCGRAGGFSVRTVARRAARVANLRTDENLRTCGPANTDAVDAGGTESFARTRYSGCSSFVAIVESTGLANGHARTDFGWLNRARFG